MTHGVQPETTGELSQANGPPARSRWAWLPLPVLLATILGLWVADLGTIYDSRYVMVALKIGFSWLAALFICILTAVGFIRVPPPGPMFFFTLPAGASA